MNSDAPLQLNIVSFNVPYPPDYGGSIDVYYRIRALAQLGVRIHLHCFTYRDHIRQAGLEQICEKVTYYRRKRSFILAFSVLPYIVSTRSSRELLKNLKNSKAPVLFEGLHTCRWIDHPDLSRLTRIVRMHNVEHRYYRELCRASGNPFTRLFFLAESVKLKLFEKRIRYAGAVAAISSTDQADLVSRYPQTTWIPAFHPYHRITSRPGTGAYFLYHGNLSVEENLKAVKFLVKKVFKGLYLQLIIAGKNPPEKLIRMVSRYPNVGIRKNPDEAEMDNLISNAQGCVLPTFQGTGLKLKLIGTLFAGRFSIVNEKMVAGTGLESLCMVARTADEFRKIILEINNIAFTEEERSKRESILLDLFNNSGNARKLIRIIEDLQR